MLVPASAIAAPIAVFANCRDVFHQLALIRRATSEVKNAASPTTPHRCPMPRAERQESQGGETEAKAVQMKARQRQDDELSLRLKRCIRHGADHLDFCWPEHLRRRRAIRGMPRKT